MKMPLQLEVQGFDPSAHVRDLIDAGISKIEDRCGLITNCRVAIRAPGAHHRLGEPYAITISLRLPNNREVNVGFRSKGADRRYGDLSFAINDAFRRAMRQLQDQTRRLQGRVKPHSQGEVP